jgi:excisionase family DNA binding protein
MNNSALAYSVRDASVIACTGRSSVYEAIRAGELRAVKRGRRTLILDEDLRRWLQNLPRMTVKPSTQSLNEGGING